MLNIILLGPPGSGKGTQAKILIDKYQLVHMSTGDMLRAEIAADTELGRKVSTIMASGNLVNDAIVFELIRSKVAAHPQAKGFIYDGFPRNLEQAAMLDKFMKSIGQEISMMLALHVADSEVEKRMQKRALIEHRQDEANVETIRHRIATYHAQTEPLLDYYRQQGKCRIINGEGSIEDTHLLACKEIDAHGRQ